MQGEFTKAQPLLDKNGLSAEGWSREFLLQYNKIDCTANATRIKEWDWYTVTTPQCAITLSIADMGNLGYVFASLTEFAANPPAVSSQTITKAYPMGRMGMPLSSLSGDTTYTSSQVGMKFSRSSGARYLKCEFVNFCDGKNLYLNLTLRDPDRYAIGAASSFQEKRSLFHYKYRVTRMPAEGVLRFGGAEYCFSPENSFGSLSWNRAVVPTSRIQLTAATLCGTVNQEPFALFLGSELESCLYYKKEFSKLSSVEVLPPERGSLTYHIHSGDAKFHLEMEPLAQTEVRAGFLLNSCYQQQVFGNFKGKIPRKDGAPIPINNLIGYVGRFECRL